MSLHNHDLSARSLAELALIVARVGRNHLGGFENPSVASLRTVWQSSRSLERRWMKILDDWTIAGACDIEFLERMAPRIFTCEMVIRTWSTLLAGIDRQHGSDDFVRLARSAVNSLSRTRNGVLSRLLMIPEIDSIRVLQLDRLRRRCDRWNDVLVGSIAARSGCFEFAFDANRARDFSEESLIADPATGPNAVEHLVSAGLRLNFIRHLPTEPIDEPEIVSLMQSILSNFPDDAFHRNGSLRTLLEQRIAISRQRIEQRVTFSTSAIPFD